MNKHHLKEKKRHIPQRTCIICGRKTAKCTLWRLTLDEKGQIILDSKQRLPGRGAYICPSDQCVSKLLTKHGEKRLRYAFRGRAGEINHRLIETLLAALALREGGTRKDEQDKNL